MNRWDEIDHESRWFVAKGYLVAAVVIISFIMGFVVVCAWNTSLQ